MELIDKKIIVIGASTGGLTALRKVLSPLPEDFALPILIVQHFPDDGGDDFINFLQRQIHLKIGQVNERVELKSGHIYLAPSRQHIIVKESGFVEPYWGPKVHYARPSIDVLFKSVAEIYAETTIALILTGSNQDGAEGCSLIAAVSGQVFIQNPATADARQLPESSLEITPNATLFELEDAGPLLWDIVNKQ